MNRVAQHLDTELTLNQAMALVTLINRVWPSQGRTVQDTAIDLIEAARSMASEKSANDLDAARRFVIWESTRALAHAKTFRRTISTPEGVLNVLALAGVCVHSDRQGEGLGAAVVRKAFEQMDGGIFLVSLFQTDVPSFYEKLGARTINNTFVNSKNGDDPTRNPWWGSHVMIYPAQYHWPSGTIDLNGEGY